MCFCGRRERRSFATREGYHLIPSILSTMPKAWFQVRPYLGTPAESHNPPFFDLPSSFLLDLLHNLGYQGNSLWWSARALDEGAKLGLLLRCVWGKVGWVIVLASQDVWHKNLIPWRRQKVGTLINQVSAGIERLVRHCSLAEPEH